MTNTNVFSDPQSSVALLLRPPSGFEDLYQGVARSTPLPFVAADSQGRYLARDFRADQEDISAFYLRYVQVPLGATMQLLIPRARQLTLGEPAETTYTYELRWRLRTIVDHNASQENAHPFPYSMPANRGAPEDDGAARTLLPGFTSEAVVPTAPGNGNLPIVAGGAGDPQVGYATQGLYVPATVGGETIAHAPNAYFNPLLRRVLGNELSVVCYRTEGDSDTWNFAGEDGGLSNVYGRNLSGIQHPIFENVGMLLVFVAGSPAL